MTIRRRRVLQAAALTPLAALLPRLGLSGAVTPGVLVRSGRAIEVEGPGGISLSWLGQDSGETVATVEPLIGGNWLPAIDVAADRGHGPDDPAGRVHGPAVIVPGAEAYRVSPTIPVDDLRFHPLIDPVTDLSPLAVTAADAGYTTVSPANGLVIFERSNWASRGRKDTVDCQLRSSVLGLGCRSDVGLRHGVVHHTVNTNGYAPDDVPQMLRLIQSFHMDTRGWDDIGYNFVIDRFARVWQAREADIHEPITAGHTSGLNAESVGVAVLGTFTSNDPGQAVIDVLGKLLGWKLGLHGVDPLGRTLVRSAGGDFAEPDDMVDLLNISGHRDNQITVCPGNVLYGRLDEIRAAAAELVPVFGHLTPAYTLASVGVTGWAIDRFTPTSKVSIHVDVDGVSHFDLTADLQENGLDATYPSAGSAHGFAHSVPIGIDTRSIIVNARAGDGRSAQLMNLRLFAGFIDVEPTRFFAPGIYWLRQHDLTTGSLPGLYEPMDEVTRAVMATFLWRFMDSPSPSDRPTFDDIPDGKFFTEAVAWLQESEITTGTSPTEFSPDILVTRAQMATFLWRMCGRIPAPTPSPFEDIPTDTFYTEAVNWMWRTKITTGLTDTRFGPEAPVTRGELATFLHRLATTPGAWAQVAPPSSVSL